MRTIIEKDLSYKLVGVFFGIHRELGRFCRERQYADLLEKKLIELGFNFKREVPTEIADRKSNFIDFVVEGKILVELKAKPFIQKEDFYQVRRYLHLNGLELGLLVNFRDSYLRPKRILKPLNDSFVDSDEFVVSDRYQGFTLIELIVGMSVFVISLVIGTGVFIQGLKSQRLLTNEMALNNNMNLVLEQMARDIRTGYDFSVSPTEIVFKGRSGGQGRAQTVRYGFGSGLISRSVGGAGSITITSENVDVVEGKFMLDDRGNCDPWRITVVMGVRPVGSNKAPARIQTTVSSRIIPSDTGEEQYRVCRL